MAHNIPAITPPEGHVKVRSCLVTRETLREWGYEVADCSASHGTKTGPPFHAVRHAAWQAGFTVLSTHRPEERWWCKRPSSPAPSHPPVPRPRPTTTNEVA